MAIDVTPWIGEALVFTNITTLAAFGGFVLREWRRDRTENDQKQEKIETQLRVQGRLLNELAYSYTHLAEQLEYELDAEVQTERVEDLHDLASECDSRWREDDD